MWIGEYILDDDGNPVPEHDWRKWAEWYEHSERRIVQQDHIGDAFISTVFLALDHSFALGTPHVPVLWETMVFQGEREIDIEINGRRIKRKFRETRWMRRYTSRKDALRGHKRAVKFVTSKQKDLQELERMALVGGWTRND